MFYILVRSNFLGGQMADSQWVSWLYTSPPSLLSGQGHCIVLRRDSLTLKCLLMQGGLNASVYMLQLIKMKCRQDWFQPGLICLFCLTFSSCFHLILYLFVIVKDKLMSIFNASVLLLITVIDFCLVYAQNTSPHLGLQPSRIPSIYSQIIFTL